MDHAMAQFIVRNLEEEVKASLKSRALLHGFSLEEEVRQILRDAVKDTAGSTPKLGSRIASRFAKIGLHEALPELRGGAAKPANFRK
jgi:plasmid stability protein